MPKRSWAIRFLLYVHTTVPNAGLWHCCEVHDILVHWKFDGSSIWLFDDGSTPLTSWSFDPVPSSVGNAFFGLYVELRTAQFKVCVNYK